ncbi:MAG: ATP-binding cassette domain-containing protein [Planctomycetes bacterium]|nr:ATP-binding cassette domain-containing protein [Planctomycetota bacterium]
MRFEVRARVRRPSGFTLDVAFDCEAQALGIVGASGSGKSTLMDAVAGIEPGADVRLDGAECSVLPLHRRSMGYVTQDPLLFPHLTVRGNLTYGSRSDAIEPVARALSIESLLDRMPRHLSGGERRRVALARAIASRPRLLLMDEPFGGLDDTRRREAMSLLDQVRMAFDLPIILVSHLADEVTGLTDWAIRLDGGRIVDAGPTPAVLRRHETRIDNYLSGEVSRSGHVRVGDLELAAMIPESASGIVRVACYAHDILLASRRPEGLSARNVFPARIASIVPAGAATLVELEGPRLRALLTRDAVESLGLAPGREVYAVVKATSIVYLGPG